MAVAADDAERKVVFVIEGRDVATFARFADHLTARIARLEQIIASASTCRRPSFVVSQTTCPGIIFDEFHVVARASIAALGQSRRLEQRADLHGCAGWTLFKDLQRLSAKARSHLAALISQAATKRTARA